MEQDLRHRESANELLKELRLLKDWRQKVRQPPEQHERSFIIEFAGMPKAGKSTLIDTLRHYFSHGPKVLIRTARVPKEGAIVSEGFKVHTPAEGVSLRTPTFLKSRLVDFNVWAGAYAIQELLQARHDHYHDLVILDRGPWDAGCWLQYVRDNTKELEESSDADHLIGFFQLNHWMTQADLHVVLVVDPATAARRESDERLIDHLGPASDKVLMTAMRKIYQERFKQLQRAKASVCPHVGDDSAVLIDTTNKHPKETAIDVIKAVFKVLEAKLAAHATDGDLNEAGVTVAFLETKLGRYRDQMKTHDWRILIKKLPSLVDRVNRSKTARAEFATGLDEVLHEPNLYNALKTFTAEGIFGGLESLVENLEKRDQG